MSQQQRHMHLVGFLIAGPVAHSHALWRHPAHPVPFLSVDYYVEIARLLERGDLICSSLLIASPSPTAMVATKRAACAMATRMRPDSIPCPFSAH